jgi:hypothetical protein
MNQVNYSYEILIIDGLGKSEITTVKSLSKALGYSEKLWEDAEIKDGANEALIEDKIQGLSLQVNKVGEGSDPSKNAHEAAFLLSIKSSNFEKIEPFRVKLLQHIINKLGFASARIVSDTISEKIAQNIYPHIKDVENAFRKNLVKTFTQKEGFSWLEAVAPKSVLEGIQQRKVVTNVFDGLVDTSASFTNFSDLTEMLSKVSYADISFKTNWAALSELRDKVLSYAPLVKEDYNLAHKVSKDLLSVIAQNDGALRYVKSTPTAGIEPLKASVSISSQAIAPEPIPEPVIEVKKETPPPVEKKPVVNLVLTEEPIIKQEPVLASVSSEVGASSSTNGEQKMAEQTKTSSAVLEEDKPYVSKATTGAFDIISEQVFLSELKEFERSQNGQLVNLKLFVTHVLGDKGYSSGPAYSLSKSLSESGKVTVYDTKDNVGLIVKAIRSN